MQSVERKSPSGMDPARSDRRMLAFGLMAVAGVFSGIVIGIMVMTFLASRSVKPPTSETLTRLMAVLDKNPTDQAVKDAIRDEDERVRQADLAARRRIAIGAWLLTLGLVGLVAAARWYSLLESRPPVIDKSPPVQGKLKPRTRNVAAASVVGVLLAAGFVAMVLVGGAPVPPPQTGAGNQQSGTLAPVPKPAFKENWPGFRGPGGMGLAPQGQPFPRTWDAPTGRNVLWKVAVPEPGKSSPVLWGDRVFLTGGDERRQIVLCFSRVDGRLLWQKQVQSPESMRFKPGELTVSDDTGYAAATPVTEGKRLYVTFATGDVAALDFDGNIVWVRNLAKPDNMYGLASSLRFYEGMVIVQLDQGATVEDKLSAMLALDAGSGSTVWRTERPVPSSWSTPVIASTPGRSELIAAGSPWVIAYDPAWGTVLWQARGLSGDVAPSPVYADGLAYASNEGAQLMAIRTDGAGDVTETHVAWTADQGLPDAASPVTDGKRLVQVSGYGTITCYTAKDGKLLWKRDVSEAGFWSSPTLAGNTVYLTDKAGKTFIFELADQYALSGTGQLGERVDACPAFADSCIYMRGKQHLFCIGEPGTDAGGPEKP